MVSKIKFEKFFDRIQKLIGIINKKKNKNDKIEEKQKIRNRKARSYRVMKKKKK